MEEIPRIRKDVNRICPIYYKWAVISKAGTSYDLNGEECNMCHFLGVYLAPNEYTAKLQAFEECEKLGAAYSIEEMNCYKLSTYQEY